MTTNWIPYARVYLSEGGFVLNARGEFERVHGCTMTDEEREAFFAGDRVTLESGAQVEVLSSTEAASIEREIALRALRDRADDRKVLAREQALRARLGAYAFFQVDRSTLEVT